jgi:hypothetical protein
VKKSFTFLCSVLFCFLLSSGPLGAQDDDEKILNELEEDREQSTAQAVQMNDMSENLKNQLSSVPQALKQLGESKLNPASLMDEKVVLSLKAALKNNPLKTLPKEEVRALIFEKIQSEKVKNYLVNHPKILDTWIEILQDDKALPSAVGIFLRKSDLKLYGFIWLGLLVFSWIFKKIYFSKDWTFLHRLFMSFLMSISVSVISFGTFYTMFYDELSPAVKIIVKNWRQRNI